jgi:hypothetical protein
VYSEDSFFTLSQWGQLGLLILSGFLCATLLWGFYKVRLPVLIHMSVSVLVLWTFVWVSPQIYYSYYLLLIEGLPLQLVIRVPPTPLDILGLYTFGGTANLSTHSQGALGWCLLLAPVIKRLRRDAAN